MTRLKFFFQLIKLLWFLSGKAELKSNANRLKISLDDLVFLIEPDQIRLYSHRYWVNDHKAVLTNSLPQLAEPTADQAKQVHQLAFWQAQRVRQEPSPIQHRLEKSMREQVLASKTKKSRSSLLCP